MYQHIMQDLFEPEELELFPNSVKTEYDPEVSIISTTNTHMYIYDLSQRGTYQNDWEIVVISMRLHSLK